MRIIYKELMEKLGAGYELSPYETRPWFLHDEEKGIACSAEVRVGPGAEDVEVEIQFLHDEESTSNDPDDNIGPEQIMLMRFIPTKDSLWSASLMLVKGKNYNNQIYNWGERGTEFFCSCIGALQMGEIPDIDTLIEELLTDSKSGGRGRRGRVGKKGLKMQQQPPMGMGMKQ